MKSLQNKESQKPTAPTDDEVGAPIWKMPVDDGANEDTDDYEDDEDEDVDEIYPVPMVEGEMGIHAPGFDPLLQQEWEERERLRREREAEKKGEENPRGIWKM